MKEDGDAVRAAADQIEQSVVDTRKAWETFGTSLSVEETTANAQVKVLRSLADHLDTLVAPTAPPSSGVVIPPIPTGFQVVSMWDFQQSILPSGWKDDGLTFNYGDRGDQKLDAVNLMRNVVYNPTKKCTELWGRKEDYPVPGSSGYWATAHYTACSIAVEANWLPGMRVEVFGRLNPEHRSCWWSSHGPDEFDFCEHFAFDAPQYNKPQSDHWAVITSYNPTKQYTPVKPALNDGKPHLFWCDYLVDGANVKMGRDTTTMNTVAKANLKDPTMSHGIRVGEEMGGTWDGGYDAVQRGYWPSIQIPSTPSCSDVYMVRLLRKTP